MMKIFYNYHLHKYPLIQKEDKIKLIYQSTLGPNHLGRNLLYDNVKQRLEKELLDSLRQLDFVDLNTGKCRVDFPIKFR